MAETTTPESRVAQEVDDLTKLTIQRLRMKASSLGLTGVNKMTKVKLIEAIRERESAAERPEESKPKTPVDLDDLAGKLGNRMAPTVAKALEDELNKAVGRVCTAVWEAYQDLAKKEGKSVPPMPEDVEKLLKVVTVLIAEVSSSINRFAIMSTKIDSLEASFATLNSKLSEQQPSPKPEPKGQTQPQSKGRRWQGLKKHLVYWIWNPTLEPLK